MTTQEPLFETTEMIEIDFYQNATTENANPTPLAGDELIIPDVIRLIEFDYKEENDNLGERLIQKSIDENDSEREKMEQMPDSDWSQYDEGYDVIYEYNDNVAKMTGKVTEVTEATLELPNDDDDGYSYASYSSYTGEEYYDPDDISPVEDYVQVTTKLTSTTEMLTTTEAPPMNSSLDIENLSFLQHHSPLPKEIDQNGTCTQINIDFQAPPPLYKRDNMKYIWF